MSAVSNDMLSVASQQVGAGDYSCLSLYFSEEPIARGSDISFQWAVGRGAGSGSSSLLFWVAPTGDDRLPTVDPGQPSISQSQAGFSAWMRQSAMAGDLAVPELRWCYFGAVSSAGDMDFGRVDRLEVVKGIGVSFVAAGSKPGAWHCRGRDCHDCRAQRSRSGSPAALSRFVCAPRKMMAIVFSIPAVPMWSRKTRSPGGSFLNTRSLEMGLRETMCWSCRLGTTFVLKPGSIIRLTLLDPPPTAEYRVSAPSSGYLIAVEDSRRQIMGYCTALNIPAALCDRVSGPRL